VRLGLTGIVDTMIAGMALQQLDLWQAREDHALRASPATTPRRPSSASLQLVPAPPAAPAISRNAATLYYLENALAPSTREAYASDWQQFERWCTARSESPLPAAVATLAEYLADLAQQGRKASTIRRARKVIGARHAELGLPRPDRDARIRRLERGIGRIHGTREQGPAPLLIEDLARVVHTLGDSPRADRDRLVLVLGFAGAFRESDLVALDVDHLTIHPDRLTVRLPRSKEDQLALGVTTELPRAANPELCAIAAFERWLARVGCSAGPLLRRVRGPRIYPGRVSVRLISRVVETAAARAGLRGDYSAHSLRSGFATSAWAHGVSERDIQQRGRWKDRHSLDRYIDHGAIRAHTNVFAGLM
jgi:site-specific recombinase XerD